MSDAPFVRDFLGKGLAFPLEEDPETGDFKRVEDAENIRQCLLQLVLTARFERVMRAAFGSVIPELLFEDAPVARDLIVTDLRTAIERFEPRVVLTQDPVARIDQENSTRETIGLRIAIRYRIRATNTVHNLVFPFYLKQAA